MRALAAGPQLRVMRRETIGSFGRNLAVLYAHRSAISIIVIGSEKK